MQEPPAFIAELITVLMAQGKTGMILSGARLAHAASNRFDTSTPAKIILRGLRNPDKFQNMAPELQTMATEQLAKLNELYKGVCEEKNRAVNACRFPV